MATRVEIDDLLSKWGFPAIMVTILFIWVVIVALPGKHVHPSTTIKEMVRCEFTSEYQVEYEFTKLDTHSSYVYEGSTIIKDETGKTVASLANVPCMITHDEVITES